MTNRSGEIRQDCIAGNRATRSNVRLSGVAQAVRWQIDPATYGGNTTFDSTVTFDENSAASQAYLLERAIPPRGVRIR
jgi:hypothetical protein